MKNSDTISLFYREKEIDLPTNYNVGTSYFVVIKIESKRHREAIIAQYSFNRKNLYKIKLIKGKCKCHFADKTIFIEKYALVFVNPLVPFILEEIEEAIEEHFCLFNVDFFTQFGNIKSYPVFQQNNNSIFLLTEEEFQKTEHIFIQMKDEMISDYLYKFDIVRMLVYNIIHDAIKNLKNSTLKVKEKNVENRIALLFEELLEMQFPLQSRTDVLQFKKPKDFASQLSITINHLNKNVQKYFKKSTSEVINERIMQEAKILLKYTTWSVSEIAYLLGYETPSRFTYTFNKNFEITPSNFRKLNTRN